MTRSGFRLTKIYGISINVDWSWLFILLLITWNLASIFRQVHPAWGTGPAWGLALLGALLFFASVLAHELAHSLVARSQGLPVRNITLFLFGGVSNIQREPASPKNEFWMAIAGPLTSLVLGALMLLVSVGPLVGTRNLAQPGLIAANLSPINTILLWLGSINIILAIFNMIPGFPLDGGRVLRSIIWGITHNLRTATSWASAIGQAIAWIMIVAGIAMAFGLRIPFFGTGFISGLWLAFIGWFLNSAAVQSNQQIEIQDILEGVPVASLMRRNPPTVAPDCTVSALIHDHVMGSDDQAFPVLQDDRLVGIVTLDDVRRVPRDEWGTRRVQDIMTPGADLVTVTPTEDAAQALEKLMQRDVRQLPVVVPAVETAAPTWSAERSSAGSIGSDAARSYPAASSGEIATSSGGIAANPLPIPTTGARPDVQAEAPAAAPQFVGLLRRSDIMRWLQLHSRKNGDGNKPK